MASNVDRTPIYPIIDDMDEKKRERITEIAIVAVTGIMLMIPLILWLIKQGVFGKISLVGASDFSPIMDRFFLLSIMFFVMYGVSWMNSLIKYRAVKVFTVVAFLAILSVAAIQMDDMLVTAAMNQVVKDAVNVWFLNLPGYLVLALSTGYIFEWQTWLTLLFFVITSGIILWQIKVELASSWRNALNMWWVFEIVYCIVIWIVFNVFQTPMFPPTIV